MTQAAEQAKAFSDTCKTKGWRWVVPNGRNTVRITHEFTPGDREGFRTLDCDITSLLYTLPHDGSVYGVDGVGGAIALEAGHGTVSVTGVRSRVITALSKIHPPH